MATKDLMLVKEIILTIVLVSLASCHNNTKSTLLKADSIIESNPDSAYILLEEISNNSISEKDIPYYALLLTQAEIKCGEELKSDSLIKIAFRHYQHDESTDRGIRSKFYLSMIYYNQGLFYEATKLALNTLNISIKNKNHYWTAKSAELLRDIFFHSRNYTEAKKYSLQAIDIYKKCNRTSNLIYALCDLAINEINLSQYESAYTLLDSIWNATGKESNPDRNLMIYVRMPLINSKVKTGRFEDISKSDIDFLDEMKSEPEWMDAAIIKSRIYSHYHPNSIDKSLQSILNESMALDPKTNLLYSSYQNAKNAGEYKIALDIVDSLIYCQNQVAWKILQESAVRAQRDFFSNEAAHEEFKSQKLSWIIVSIILFSIAAGFLLWHIYRLKSINHKRQLEDGLSYIHELKSQAETLQNDMRNLSRLAEDNESRVEYLNNIINKKLEIEHQNAIVIEHLFKEKWSTLNMLCNEYFNLGDTEASKKSIINNIEKELNKIRSKNNLKEIESAVDMYMGGMVTTLRNQCPCLKNDDILFLSLIMAGFSVRAVCLFTGVTYKFFYVKKSRLIEKISRTEFPQKEKILTLLK